MRNSFIERFRKKSDQELEHISTHIEGYIDEAREAAIQVLKERKDGIIITANEDDEDPQEGLFTENTQAVTASENPEPKTGLSDDPDTPELHSKLVITAFSVLFSTLFGAVLLMYNMKHTNNPKGRTMVLIFGLGYTILIGNLLQQFQLSTIYGTMANYIGALILNEYFWNKYIGKDFQYRKRSWIKPAVFSILITIPLALFMFYEF